MGTPKWFCFALLFSSSFCLGLRGKVGSDEDVVEGVAGNVDCGGIEVELRHGHIAATMAKPG